MKLKNLSLAIVLVFSLALMVCSLAPPGSAQTAIHYTQAEAPSIVICDAVIVSEVSARTGPIETTKVASPVTTPFEFAVTPTERYGPTDKLRMPLASRASGAVINERIGWRGYPLVE